MESKFIAVVGGSHGIGLKIVERCAALGAQVLVFSRTVGDLAQLPHALSQRVQHNPLDVLQQAPAAEQFPAVLHGFVYAPGSIELGMLRGLDPQQLRDDFELNVIGAVRCFQAALAGLKAARGSAVFFSTVAVAQGLPMHSSIAAAKGALEALVRTWAAELAPAVRVNAIAPALTDTPLAAKFLSTPEKRQAMDARHPLGRIGTADDIAAMAEFLLGDQATWITGQVHRVDGGLSSIRK